MLALLGFEQANAVYAGLEPSKRQTLVWHSVFIAASVGGGIAVLGAVWLTGGAFGSQTLIRGPLWLYAVALSMVPVALASEYFRAILRGMNQIFMLNVLEVGVRVAQLILFLALVGWLRLEVVGAVWGEFILNLLILVVTIALLSRLGAFRAPRFDRSLLGRTASFDGGGCKRAIATFDQIPASRSDPVCGYRSSRNGLGWCGLRHCICDGGCVGQYTIFIRFRSNRYAFALVTSGGFRPKYWESLAYRVACPREVALYSVGVRGRCSCEYRG
jgi:hypothetical protein